jgi:hypothetical protein
MGIVKKVALKANEFLDRDFLGNIFPGSRVYTYMGWAVTEISTIQMISFTGKDGVELVNTDGSETRSWRIAERVVTLREDQGIEYRAYLVPESNDSA